MCIPAPPGTASRTESSGAEGGATLPVNSSCQRSVPLHAARAGHRARAALEMLIRGALLPACWGHSSPGRHSFLLDPRRQCPPPPTVRDPSLALSPWAGFVVLTLLLPCLCLERAHCPSAYLHGTSRIPPSLRNVASYLSSPTQVRVGLSLLGAVL